MLTGPQSSRKNESTRAVIQRQRWTQWSVVSLAIAVGAVPRPGRCAGTPVPLPPAPLRPDAAVGPTKLSVGIWVGDISRIDSVSQTFTANFLLVLRWRDAQLAHDQPGIKRYQLDEIWHPSWIIVNEAGSVEHSLPEVAEVAGDGSVIYRQRLVGSFAQALDLREFPFDQGTFRVHLVLGRYRPEEIQFVPDESIVAAGLATGSGIAPALTLQDWKVTSYTTRALPYQVVPGLEAPGYAFEFTAARNTRHFVVKVIIPLVLIVMMSWAVFWIEPDDANSQLAVAVTAMLTLIAYRFAIDSDIPELPYLTRLDSFILASTVLVFLSLIEVLVTNKLANRDQMATARKIDRVSRVVFPTGFAILTAAVFLL